MSLHAEIARARSVGLTRSQLRYLTALHRLTAGGEATTHRAIARSLGVGVAAVYQQLLRLRRDGYATWRDGQARTIRVTEAGAAVVVMAAPPVVERAGVACGAR